MSIRNQILEELEKISKVVAKAGQKTPYEAPPGYFESLADIVLNRIKAAETSSPKEELKALSPLLSQLDKKNPFSTPQGYFQDLTHDIIDGINAIEFVHHELETLSPLMNAAKNKNVYQVPQGYFDNLANEILKKAKAPQQAKVISLSFSKKLIRNVAAAVLIGVMAVGAWLFFENKPSSAGNEALAGIEKVSDDEIVKYLEATSVTLPEYNTVASSDIKEEDVKELLADVPDEELQQYLEQYSVSKDLPTN